MTVNAGIRVAVDIGGTFTDIVVTDPSAGEVRTHKVLSTPEDPSLGMLHGIDQLGIAEQIGFLVHGTTAGLNALLSRTGERIALVTTAGFEDVLVLGRAGNSSIWSLRPQRPTPLAFGEDVRGLDERVRFDGSVERSLQDAEVDALAAWLEAEGITSVAVCLLHSPVNPVHELQVRARLQHALPGCSIVLSHEASSEVGEFERTSTTVATSYVSRTVDRYLSNLVEQLRDRACTAPLNVMRSSGGICSARMVARQPIQTILSGPAGGVVAAETIAKALERPNLIGIDMGGTSADVSLVIDAQATLNAEGTIAQHVMRMPVVELHTIGAGGGSIARAEQGGLRVGPSSAGADPGPACYGLGGKLPTVTDAQLLLGRIDPDWFLGGRMKLSVDAAEEAIGTLGRELGLDASETAEGVVAVANAMMANAIRTLALRRGIDPRDFSLMAFGGAGPLHGAALADELGIQEVIVPFGTGVLSAWGMLHADVRHDLSAPLSGRTTEAAAVAARQQALAELRGQGRALLDAEGVPAGLHQFVPAVDMRYAGQEHAITVEVPETSDLVAAFHDTYRRRYGHAMPGAAVEYVNARVAAIGRVGASITPPPPGTVDQSAESTRDVRVDGVTHRARIVRRDAVGTEAVAGPAIVLEDGSTTLVPPGWSATGGPVGTLVLRKVSHP
ncbi:hydantoinase/oxoprolinase family protein [Saccharopolyspora shandongensis]|uniref:hydantoinase/oxoprolinase family protein n=1 Tax=Saccharopolyspora shandongensis TaxID=418495 RepID=UPI003439BE35